MRLSFGGFLYYCATVNFIWGQKILILLPCLLVAILQFWQSIIFSTLFFGVLIFFLNRQENSISSLLENLIKKKTIVVFYLRAGNFVPLLDLITVYKIGEPQRFFLEENKKKVLLFWKEWKLFSSKVFGVKQLFSNSKNLTQQPLFLAANID